MKVRNYLVETMKFDDIVQVSAIDRHCFPEMWPPINFKHELSNRLAHYLVVIDISVSQSSISKLNFSINNESIISRVSQLIERGGISPTRKTQERFIVGYTGLWLLADEAHLISIAVKETYQNKGIGELLLISTIELAIEVGARILTLEVRESNLIAQELYLKYGFITNGIRKNYYLDNRENAVIMTIDDLHSKSYTRHLLLLKGAHIKELETRT
jgi:ribosomal-protein-alanine N-acetyltransferase